MVMIWLALAPLLFQMPSLDEQLLEAARKGDLAAVEALSGKGANLEAKSPYGQTPLFFAARNGHTAVVRFLLGKGAKLDVRDSFYKMSLVAAAADRGNTETVKALLEAGAAPGDVLGTASYRGNKELVALVLETGKASQQELSSALMAAEQAKQNEIAEMLKKAGAAPPPKPTAAVPPEKLAQLAGTYKNDQIGEVAIQVKEAKLFANIQGGSFELGAFNETTFGLVTMPQVGLKFTVENGRAVKLTTNQSGMQFELARVEAK